MNYEEDLEDDVLDEYDEDELITACQNCEEIKDVKELRRFGLISEYQCGKCGTTYQVNFNNER
ncbi:hypothetical protein [Lysinibacillus sphaericus]|uniref:hypothetical protein n=1 Tax=Lysinibacillus sphaericus TaxID=1421 RepID=UPI003D00F2CB